MLVYVNENVGVFFLFFFLLLSTTYKLADIERQVGGARWMYVTETPSDPRTYIRSHCSNVDWFTILNNAAIFIYALRSLWPSRINM